MGDGCVRRLDSTRCEAYVVRLKSWLSDLIVMWRAKSQIHVCVGEVSASTYATPLSLGSEISGLGEFKLESYLF